MEFDAAIAHNPFWPKAMMRRGDQAVYPMTIGESAGTVTRGGYPDYAPIETSSLLAGSNPAIIAVG